MRIFVTGATGWIGSAVVAELLAHDHQVLGLARSPESAAALTAVGAEVHLGTLDEPDALQAPAQACDGVIHLGYNHDFSRMAEAAQTDRAAIEAFGTALAGSDRPLVVASGLLGLKPGHVSTELDQPDVGGHPRMAGVQVAMELADQGVRSVAARFSPTVHGHGDHGFVAVLTAIAQERGTSAYIDEGTNRWPAVHRLDAAALVRLALEDAAPGTAVHAVAEEGIATRAIAEAIGASLDLPVTSVASADALDHFGWMAMMFGLDAAASNALTRERLGWEPTHPGLLDDIATGGYLPGATA